MSLLQRSLDPEKTLGLVDVLYTAVFDLQRWKERKSVSALVLESYLHIHPSRTIGLLKCSKVWGYDFFLFLRKK